MVFDRKLLLFFIYFLLLFFFFTFPLETVCMKCQTLFLEKKFKMASTDCFTQSAKR